MKTSDSAIQLIKQFEDFSATMYFDAAGLPTIGYGTLLDTKEEEYLKTAVISRVEAERLMKKDLLPIERELVKLIRVPINQNQYDALASFCYNLGTGALKISTLLKKLNQNPNDPTIRSEFHRWIYADGKKIPGLLRRRNLEAELYFSLTPSF
jgi:lysozyme